MFGNILPLSCGCLRFSFSFVQFEELFSAAMSHVLLLLSTTKTFVHFSDLKIDFRNCRKVISAVDLARLYLWIIFTLLFFVSSSIHQTNWKLSSTLYFDKLFLIAGKRNGHSLQFEIEMMPFKPENANTEHFSPRLPLPSNDRLN